METVYAKSNTVDRTNNNHKQQERVPVREKLPRANE